MGGDSVVEELGQWAGCSTTGGRGGAGLVLQIGEQPPPPPHPSIERVCPSLASLHCPSLGRL